MSTLGELIQAHQAAFEAHSAALVAEDEAIEAANESLNRPDLCRTAAAAIEKREATGAAESLAAHAVFSFPCRTLEDVQTKAKYLLGKNVWSDFIPDAEHVAIVLQSLIPDQSAQ